jgi:hypothetical protein
MTDLRPFKQSIELKMTFQAQGKRRIRPDRALAPTKVLVSTLGYACVVTFETTLFVALEEQSSGRA